MTNNATLSTPIGPITITSNEHAITSISVMSANDSHTPHTPLLKEAAKQIDAYFNGKLHQFSLPMDYITTPFRKKIWQLLQDIPFGDTLSYQDIATMIGNKKACRAVGQAIHHNPLAIIIPCHRVVGKNGNLTGYAYGVDKKKWLLTHETHLGSNS